MEWMKSWLLAITCAAVIAAVADALSPQGTPKKLVRVAGGLLMLLAVLGPVKKLESADLADLLAKYQAQYSGYSEALAQANRDVMKDIIAEETSAYILDKAAALGVTDCTVTVTCRMTDEGFPVPETVTVRGRGSAQAWADLRRAITADFAIEPENQTFERTDAP